MADEDLQVFATLVLVSDDTENQRRFDEAVAKLSGGSKKGAKGAGPLAAQATADAKAAEDAYEKAMARIRKIMADSASKMRADRKRYSPLEVAEYQRETKLILAELEHRLKEIRRIGRASDFQELEATKQGNRQRNEAQALYNRQSVAARNLLYSRMRGIDAEARQTRNLGRRTEAAKEVVAEKEAARQRTNAINAGLKRTGDAWRSSLRRREQDQSDAQARQRRAQAVVDREAARSASEAGRSRIQAQARVDREAARSASEAGQARLQAQRAADREAQIQSQSAARSLYVQEQAQQARRTALFKAGLHAANNVVSSGLRATTTVWESFWRRREQKQRSADARSLEVTKSTLSRENSEIRASLERQNAIYSASAARRLAKIEAASATETKVITAAQVRQAEAQAAANNAASSGLVGLATGRATGASALRRALPAVGLGAAFLGSLRAGYDRLTTIEDATASLTVTLGDATKAAALLDDVLGVVRGTQFNLDNFANAAQLMAGMGISAQKIPFYLTAIGEASAKKGKDANEFANRLVEAFGKIQTSGRVYLDQINSLSEAGVPALQILANAWNVNVDEMRKLISKGVVPAKRALDVLSKGIIEGSDGIAGSTVALGGSMANLRKQTSGALGGLKAAYARFGESVLGPFIGSMRATFNGLSAALDFTGERLNSLLTTILQGQGVWRAARYAILGVVGALTAMVAAKAAVEVVGLLTASLKLLTAAMAANPLLLVASGLAVVTGALVALVATNDKVRSFFTGLVEGTRDWIKVGYAISRPVTELSRLVAVQSSIGAGARTVHDFFAALTTGTRNWIKVGYAIDRPVTELSRMVTLQSSIGAFGRAFFDGMTLVSKGVGALRNGNFDVARGYGSLFIADLRNSLTPAGAAIIESLKEAFSEVQDWMRTEALPRLAQTRLSTGAFLLTALGLTGSGGGIASRVLRKSISTVFVNSVKNLDNAQGAVELGQRVNEMMQRAVERARAIGISTKDLFAGLIGSKSKATDEDARKVGENLRALIADGLKRVGDFLAPAGKFFGELGDTIIAGFGTYVLPKLVELPRMLGYWLSNNLFRENVIKAVLAAGAALAIAAAAIAVQFVRGFAEGLWDRRGDIAAVLADILRFIVKSIVGSGNPFLILGSLLLAGFAFYKVKAAFGDLSAKIKVAMLAASGDIEGARTASYALREEVKKIGGPAGRFADAGVAAGNGWRKTREFVSKASASVTDLTVRTQEWGSYFTQVGAKIESGAVKPLGRGQAAADLLGSAATRTGGLLTALGRTGERAMAELADAGQRAKAGIQLGFEWLRSNAQRVTNTAMASAAAGFSGYMAAMSNDATTKTASIIGSIASIGTAFAKGDTIGGALAAGTAVFGYFIGDMQKKAKAAKEQAQKDANEAAAATKRIADSAREGFRAAGDAGVAGQIEAINRVLTDASDQGGKQWTQFTGIFDANTQRFIEAAAKGGDAARDYANSLLDNAVSKTLAGDAASVKEFSDEIDAAAAKASASLAAALFPDRDRNEQQMTQYEDAKDALGDLFDEYGRGEISIDEFNKRIAEAGGSADDARLAYDLYASALRVDIGNSPGGLFLRNLPGQLDAARRAQQRANEISADTKRLLLDAAPAADAFAAAYESIRDKLDKARQAWKDWVDATSGAKRTTAQTELDILSEVEARKSRAEGGLTRAESLQDQTGLLDLQSGLADIAAELAKTASGPEDLKKKVTEFLDSVVAKTPEAKGVVEDLKTILSDADQLFINAFDSVPAIETFKGFKTEFSNFLLTRPDLKLNIDTSQGQEKKDAIFAALQELTKTNWQAKVFLEKGGQGGTGWDNTYAAIVNQIDAISGTHEVVFEAKWKESGGFLGLGARIDSDLLSRIAPWLANSAAGRLVKHPMLSTLGEDGPEVVLPLTRPNRMAELLSLPEVQAALGRIPSGAIGTANNYTPANANSVAPTFTTTSEVGTQINHDVKVEQTIVESASPRLTAAESVRKIREAEFLGGGAVTPFAYSRPR